MTEQEVKDNFRVINRNSIICRVLGGILLLPLLILLLTGEKSIRGMSRSDANLLLILGMVINIIYVTKYWKCPACGKKLGSGVSIQKCPSCNADLKEINT